MKLLPKVLGMILGLGMALTGLSAASAHEFWLEPEKSRAAPDEEILITIAVGQNFIGDTLAYFPSSAARFDAYGPGGKIDQAGREFGADPAGIVRPAGRSGLYIVAYQNNGSRADIKPDLFNKYLANEGLEHILEARARAGTTNEVGREFYTRFPKTWVLAGDNVNAGRWAAAPSGLLFEMVPSENPFTLRPGDTMTLQVLYRKKPLQGIQINTFTKSSEGRIQAVRTDYNGRAKVTIDRAGRWMFAAVHAIPAPHRENADWESFWTSLTLDVPE